jgi:CHAT domain-containing protein
VRLHLDTPGGVTEALAVHEANRARAVSALRRPPTGRAPEPAIGDALERTRSLLERAILEKNRRGADELAQEFLRLLVPGLEAGAPQPPAPAGAPSRPPQHRPVSRFPFSELQSRLDTATAIIVFRLTEHVSGAWVISRGDIVWRPLSPLRELEPLISRLRWALQSPQDVDDATVKAVAKDAYLALVRPLATALESKEKIVIIPDGPLFGVPFEALVIPEGPEAGSFLLEKYQVSYQLSLGLLEPSTALVGESRAQRLLLVGDPEWPAGGSPEPKASRDRLTKLVAAREEMESVRRVFGEHRTAMLAGEAAQRQVLLGDLGEFTHIHLATHGVVRERDPWESYLAFSGRDGLLTLGDVTKIRVAADLVVLSACETGRGRLLAGEGAWGFVAGFLGAGAKNVVASLWRVDDHSTATLMQEFYRAMAPGFSNYGSAVRTAKLRLLTDPRWRHSYFWAPFVLYGSLNLR